MTDCLAWLRDRCPQPQCQMEPSEVADYLSVCPAGRLVLDVELRLEYVYVIEEGEDA
ncbi:MAG: hypothetical protein ABIH23_15485 [bacterium]